MNNTMGMNTGAAQSISRKTKLGLALIIAVGTAVGVLALFQPQASPAALPASANAVSAAQVSLAGERAAEHQFLAQRSAASAALVAATQRQEALKDAHLARGSAANSSVSLAQDRAAEHQFLAQRAAIAAAAQTHDVLKDRWLERGSARIAAFVAATQRQEELKDRWLARNS